MTLEDLMSFDDSSPARAPAREKVDAGDAAATAAAVAAPATDSLDQALLSFDPLADDTAAAPAPACRALEVPAQVAAAFSAQAAAASGPPAGTAGAVPLGGPSTGARRLVGTWRYKRDPGCTYQDFDSECLITEGEGGRLNIREPQSGSGAAAVGILEQRGDWFEAELTVEGEGDAGAVRFRLAEGSADAVVRCFRAPGEDKWEETVAQRGLSQEERAELMRQTGVGQQAQRYREERDRETAEVRDSAVAQDTATEGPTG